MKAILKSPLHKISKVAPLVGAWIERVSLETKTISIPVAPLVGAWIESQLTDEDIINGLVAPLVGAWIEILDIRLHLAM